jgi:hypothetical protein
MSLSLAAKSEFLTIARYIIERSTDVNTAPFFKDQLRALCEGSLHPQLAPPGEA